MEPTTNNPAPQAAVALGRYAASKLIVKESWAIMMSDKEIMWFPFITAILNIAVFVIFAILLFFGPLGGALTRETQMSDVYYIYAFFYYLVTFFVINFFQSALYIIVQGRFGGQNLSFKDGVHGATEKIGKIALWSLISATVGMILRIIADKSKIIGGIVVMVLGSAWNILTYFSLPSLIIGNTSIKDSFKESASVIKKTWGESIIINLGVGVFFSLIHVLIVVIAIILMFIAPFAPSILGIIILAIVAIVGTCIIQATLGSIFKLALYNYAKTGQVPPGFTPQVVATAIKPKVQR